MIKCSRCGSELEPDALFCHVCGHKRAGASCSACGSPVAGWQEFCRKCGAPVRPEESPASESDAGEIRLGPPEEKEAKPAFASNATPRLSPGSGDNGVRRRIAVVAGVIAALAIVVVVAWAASRGDGGDGTTTTAAPVTLATTTPTAPPTTAATVGTDSATWRYHNDAGYAYTAELTVWDAIAKNAMGTVTHPWKSRESSTEDWWDYALATGVDYDPVTDIAIPLALQATNTSEGFDLYDATVHLVCDGLVVNDPSYTVSPARSVEFTWFYSDGPETKNFEVYTSDSGSFGNELLVNNLDSDSSLALSVAWSEKPMLPGHSGLILGFAILHDYYTPAEPQGDTLMPDLIAIYATGADTWSVLEQDVNNAVALSGRDFILTR
jgi:hypothetical protein